MVKTRNGNATGVFIPYSRNQAQSHGYLFALADGAGAHEQDEAAATTAIAALTAEFEQADPGTMLISLLPQLIQAANAALRRGQTNGQNGRQLTTTMVACALRNDQAIVSHVGHSRCYLVRDRAARQVTQDHESEFTQGLSEPDHLTNGLRAARLSALGTSSFISPDTTALTVIPGDVLVLSTDGVHQGVGCERMADIVSQPKTADEMARELVATAMSGDGQRDATALVIRVRAVHPTGFRRAMT